MTDLCAGYTAQPSARERIFAWLAEGAREVSWALCYAAARALDGSAAGRARPVAGAAPRASSRAARAAFDAASRAERTGWRLGCRAAGGQGRIRACRRRVGCPLGRRGRGRAGAWARRNALRAPARTSNRRPTPPGRRHADTRAESSAAPIRLDTLLLRARQHELEHLADIWRVALYWDRPAPTSMGSVDLPFHPADRFSEGVTRR